MAATYNKMDGILSLGGFHPENKDDKEWLNGIKELGRKGSKIHPDCQHGKIGCKE